MKRYTPTEQDIRNREFAVMTKARLHDTIQNSLSDTFIWLIWGVIAVAFGLGVARDSAPLPTKTTAEAAAPKGAAPGSL